MAWSATPQLLAFLSINGNSHCHFLVACHVSSSIEKWWLAPCNDKVHCQHALFIAKCHFITFANFSAFSCFSFFVKMWCISRWQGKECCTCLSVDKWIPTSIPFYMWICQERLIQSYYIQIMEKNADIYMRNISGPVHDQHSKEYWLEQRSHWEFVNVGVMPLWHWQLDQNPYQDYTFWPYQLLPKWWWRKTLAAFNSFLIRINNQSLITLCQVTCFETELLLACHWSFGFWNHQDYGVYIFYYGGR